MKRYMEIQYAYGIRTKLPKLMVVIVRGHRLRRR